MWRQYCLSSASNSTTSSWQENQCDESFKSSVADSKSESDEEGGFLLLHSDVWVAKKLVRLLIKAFGQLGSNVCIHDHAMG